jgi:hypothetical protein
MATTTPASAAQDNSLFTTVLSVAALVAVVLLVYFMARGRTPGNQGGAPGSQGSSSGAPTAVATTP